MAKDKASTSEPFNLIVGPGQPLQGVVSVYGKARIPGDKSLSHRAALLGAMAEGTSIVRNFLVSGVTDAMLNALVELGVNIHIDGTTLKVAGAGLLPIEKETQAFLQCGNSATTMRLLAGGIAAWGRAAVLDGSPGLRRRPMNRIIRPLQLMGVAIDGVDGCAPLTITRSYQPLLPIEYELPVASAQVKSCLLLSALAARGESIIFEPGPSRDHTERMLRAMGVQIEIGVRKGDGLAPTAYLTRLLPPQPLRLSALDITLPNDFSAAAFLVVAALITPGSEIRLENIGLNPTRTGLLDTLLEMGADIKIEHMAELGGEPVGDLIIRHSQLHGVSVRGERVVRMIDEFPAFAVAASIAEGETRVQDAQELRNKESDRIDALGTELSNLGAAFQSTSDGFVISGKKRLKGGSASSQGDHRLAMSLALVGLAAENPVHVIGAGILAESFPDFPQVLKTLGSEIHIESMSGKTRRK